jgi:hypothetical protein
LLLLCLVMEFRDPVWSRTAIALQLFALALVSAALGVYWPLSRRFVIYPLVLIGVIYLWDTTLPPPSLPEGLLRAVVPRLALLGIAVDAALLLRRYCEAKLWKRRGRPVPPHSFRRRILVRQGIVPLDEVAQLFHVSVDALRIRLEGAGGAPVWYAGREYLRLGDVLRILAQWNNAEDISLDRTPRNDRIRSGVEPGRDGDTEPLHTARNGQDSQEAVKALRWYTIWSSPHINRNGRPARAKRQPTTTRLLSQVEVPRRMALALGTIWFVLTTIVAVAPGIELRLIADGQALSAMIGACLQPWAGWIISGAAWFDFFTFWIAIWAVPKLRQTAFAAVTSGVLGGIGLGMLLGDPCMLGMGH